MNPVMALSWLAFHRAMVGTPFGASFLAAIAFSGVTDFFDVAIAVEGFVGTKGAFAFEVRVGAGDRLLEFIAAKNGPKDMKDVTSSFFGVAFDAVSGFFGEAARETAAALLVASPTSSSCPKTKDG
jgi:hypothetical protein